MPLLLVSPVETVAGRRARVSDSQLAPLLSLSLSLILSSSFLVRHVNHGENTPFSINELRGAEETRVLCPRTRLELHSKVSTEGLR